MSVTFCPRCGGSNDESNRFCVKCGSPIAVEPAAAPEQPLIPPVGRLPKTSVPTTSRPMRVVHCTKCKTPNDASRSTCSRCGTGLPSSDPSFWTKRNKMVAGLLGVILIFGSAMLANDNNGSQSSTLPASTSENATDTPAQATPKPDLHAAREAGQHYFNRAMIDIALANITFEIAKDDIQNNDMVSASTIVDKGSKYASEALDTAGNDAPSGWDDVSNPLLSSSNHFRKSLDALHTWIDSQKPSDLSLAVSESSEANDDLVIAQSKASDKIKSMGGDPSNLLTPDQAAKEMATVISAMKQ